MTRPRYRIAPWVSISRVRSQVGASFHDDKCAWRAWRRNRSTSTVTRCHFSSEPSIRHRFALFSLDALACIRNHATFPLTPSFKVLEPSNRNVDNSDSRGVGLVLVLTESTSFYIDVECLLPDGGELLELNFLMSQ